MKEDKKARKPIRLVDFDYGSDGAYFITVCVKDRNPILSEIEKSTNRFVGQAALCLPKINLTEIGRIVDKYINRIEKVHSGVIVDEYVIMPDHIHLLLRFERSGRQGAAYPTVSDIIKAFKTMVKKETGLSLFQRSYYDHIIRNEQDCLETIQYIRNNPLKYIID